MDYKRKFEAKPEAWSFSPRPWSASSALGALTIACIGNAL
jgi:hypothetical protein